MFWNSNLRLKNQTMLIKFSQLTLMVLGCWCCISVGGLDTTVIYPYQRYRFRTPSRYYQRYRFWTPITYNSYPFGWTYADEQCYKIFYADRTTPQLNWFEAQSYCKQLNGSLASFTSRFSFNAVYEKFDHWVYTRVIVWTRKNGT